MSHKNPTRRPPAPNAGLECPLASLGRNTSAVMETLSGHTHTLQYHHPLSSSPLDPQAYQMSRQSPNLSIDADDIIYAGAAVLQQHQQQQGSSSNEDTVDGRSHERLLRSLQRTQNGLSSSSHGCLPEMYQLSRSSSHSSLEQADVTGGTARAATAAAPIMAQPKAATFELRGRHGTHSNQIAGDGGADMYTTNSTASVGRQQQRNNLQMHGNVNKTNLSAAGNAANMRNFLTLEHMLQYAGQRNAYLLHGNSADTEDSSGDTASGGGGVGNGRVINRSTRLTRHQGGRCSVPTVSGGGGGVSSAGGSSVANAQYFLDKKMDALYLGNALRSLPLGAEASHFQNERYYLEDNMHGYSSGNERLTDVHLMHQRASSPSETSGSDRYLLNRTNSPANGFSSLNQLDNFSSSNNNTSSSASNLALDQRFHHNNSNNNNKVQSLSDGLCNLGRFSPSLDQGYATLVSPSPTGHHTQTITTHSIVHHPPPLPPQTCIGKNNTITAAVTATQVPATTTAATTRRTICDTTIGPPPWNRKGPYRAGPYFDRLNDELVLRIFSWFDSCELCNVARVCRRFEQLAWRPILWKVITLRGEHLNGDKTLKMIFRQLCGQSRNGSCPEVERVMLSDGCRISDKGLQLLTRRCPELTHLQLQTCVNVTNQALVDALTKCSNLQHLDVTGCSQVTSITPHPNMEPPLRLLLQYLDLTDCMAIDDMGLKIVVKNCPQLVYLYLRRCIQITDAGLKFVPSFCVSLKELSVSDCLNITDFGLYELAKLGAALRYLSVAKCERVSDAGLKVIARRCYKLRYLNARGCEAVSDDSITVLARSCPRLRALDIGKCDVSDAGLRALAESCPNLKKLSLRNCDMITDRGVQCIAYYCRGLQQLNIQDCQISIEGYRAVKKYCKRCIIEHTNPGFC